MYEICTKCKIGILLPGLGLHEILSRQLQGKCVLSADRAGLATVAKCNMCGHSRGKFARVIGTAKED